MFSVAAFLSTGVVRKEGNLLLTSDTISSVGRNSLLHEHYNGKPLMFTYRYSFKRETLDYSYLVEYELTSLHRSSYVNALHQERSGLRICDRVLQSSITRQR